MLVFKLFFIWSFMLLQSLNYLAAVKELENGNRNLTHIRDDIWTKNVTLVNKHKLTENKEIKATTENTISKGPEEKAELNPLNATSSALKATNRTGRQLYYSPNFFFLQNYATQDSKCVTSRGLVGVCLTFNSCLQAHRNKNQPSPFSDLQHWSAVQQQFLPYFQPQPELCNLPNQFAFSSYGICCVDAQNTRPVQNPQDQEQETSNNHQPVNNDDSEVLEADLNSFEPDPPAYDSADNNIDYDPIENLKQAAFFNNNNNNNNHFIRYPWPQQFVGFSGVQQWPPPLPTHSPSIASWPPPLPTHPPNHHYPTHPPLNGVSHIHPVVTSTTTRRPTYPNYPTQRPPTATTSTSTTRTTTTTSTRKPYNEDTSALGLPLQCGLKNAEHPDQERIVGGTNASPNEFPWIAVIFKSGKQFCGGSLITNNHILTAAHCVARMTSWDVATLTAHLGDYNIRTDYEVKHMTRRIKRLVRHKGFDFSTLHNDIAILTLNEPVQYTKEIQPICLPTSAAQRSRSYTGQTATVAGWGSLRENGPQPSILQKVQIPIWSNTECAQKYGRAAPAGIISSMMCAGQVARDSCSGDSGGPLIVNDGARYIQVGIVSWGIGCGQGRYPGVYTRITSLLPWIYKNIK